MTSDRKPDWYDELTPEAQADFDGWAADENDDPAVGVTEVTLVGRGQIGRASCRERV